MLKARCPSCSEFSSAFLVGVCMDCFDWIRYLRPIYIIIDKMDEKFSEFLRNPIPGKVIPIANLSSWSTWSSSSSIR